MKIISICMCLFFIVLRLSAQINQKIIKKINISDKVPNYELKHLLNYPKEHLYLTDFKNKILILDFWSSYCSACVDSWPKLIKLQKQFKGDIIIVLVNPTEKKEQVKKVISKQEQIHKYKMTLPVAYDDSDLMTLFPHQALPHVIFIDQNQNVKYITQGTDLNEQTIFALLSHKDLDISEKTDEYNIDPYNRLFMEGNYGKQDKGQRVMWSSIITPYSIEMPSVMRIKSNKETANSIGVIVNYPLKDIFRVLYGKGTDLRLAIHNSRVEFDHLDSSHYVFKVDNIFQRQNLYTIQVISAKYLTIEQVKSRMINDLEQYFNLKTNIEKRKKLCMVISRSGLDLTQYTTGEKIENMGETYININNISMVEFIDQIGLFVPSFSTMSYPIIDETNFRGKLGKIFFQLKKPLDYKNIGIELLKYGLKFSLEMREVDMLIITKDPFTDSIPTS